MTGMLTDCSTLPAMLSAVQVATTWSVKSDTTNEKLSPSFLPTNIDCDLFVLLATVSVSEVSGAGLPGTRNR